MRPNQQTKGFTIVELMLAMSFLSVLLLAIAMLVINVTNIYTRGVTLTTVQRVGQAISSELKQTLNQAQPDNIAYITFGNGGSNGGRLCTGTITYAWNYGRAITGTGSAFVDVNKYTDGTKNIRFVKTQDNGGGLCKKSGGNYPNLTKAQAVDMGLSSDRTVALYGFTFYPQALASSAQTLYSINMVVGTDSSGFIAGQNQCAPAADASDNFCAVNQFMFTIRASTQNTASGGNGQ